VKIIIKEDNKILDEIVLTPIQEKALILMEDNFLVNKIKRILDFGVEQARQIYIKAKEDAITEEEFVALADEIEERKAKEKPDEEPDEEPDKKLDKELDEEPES